MFRDRNFPNLIYIRGYYNIYIDRYMHTHTDACVVLAIVVKADTVKWFQILDLEKGTNPLYNLGSSALWTEKDVDTRLTKAWTAIDRLSIIWKSDLNDKMKRSFFRAAIVSILLYACTTWTLTKRFEKKLDGNYTRMLRAILNKCWRQHPTRHQLYGHLPPIAKTIQARRDRHTGHW